MVAANGVPRCCWFKRKARRHMVPGFSAEILPLKVQWCSCGNEVPRFFVSQTYSRGEGAIINR